LITDGPWEGSSGDNLLPPRHDKLKGIAELFGTTTERVARMISADWYGVTPRSLVSDRVKKLIPLIDGLSDEDALLVESLLRRLSERKQ
jgi:hypothetical protein